MAAAMDGVDALVFSGGIGEHAPALRARAVEGFEYLGLAIDAALNTADGTDRDVSDSEAPARTIVVEAREDLEIARQVRAVLDDGDAP